MPANDARRQLGNSGEQLAQRYLESLGYRFVTRNWHCRAGELDLVMVDDDILVFVEVKARRGERAGRAEEAISHAKAHRLLATGEWFVADHPEFQEMTWRCDLVAITYTDGGHPAISHYVNAIVEG